MTFPPEFDLAAACCRWPPSAARDAAVRAAAARPINWAFFRRVVARQRVEGLVHDALGRAAVGPPVDVAEPLAAAAGAVARENLLFAAESHRLRKLLDSAGVPFVFVKGATLAILAYGTLALKRAIDIDIAVAPEAQTKAFAVLRGTGYRCSEPGEEADDAAILAWTARHKHSAWRRGCVMVELHAALVDSPDMLEGVTLASPRQDVPVTGGITLPTFATDELFAYLCVHGATHAWSRLKWLADVNALLAVRAGNELERLHARSLELGAGRASGQALLLCRELFGLDVPSRLEAELRRDAGTRHLVSVALESLVRGGADAELDSQVLGTAAIHVSHLRLRRGLRFKFAEILRKLRSVGGGPLAVPRWLLRRLRDARR